MSTSTGLEVLKVDAAWIFESAPDAMVLVQGDGRIAAANAQTEKLFGYGRAELVGEPVEKLLPERFRNQHSGHRSQYAGEPRTRPMGAGADLCGLRKDGSEFPIEMSVSPVETGSGTLTLGAIRNVSDLKRVEELRQQLEFQRLLVELSTLFINLPPDQIDGQIEEAQKQICEVLGLDRSTLAQVDEASKSLRMTHRWAAPGFPRAVGFTSADIPWATSKIFKGEHFQFSSLDDLPPEAAKDKETLRQDGVKANVTFPLLAGNKVFGAIAFGLLRGERDWPEHLVSQFQLIAQIFANALARRRAELSRRESEERFRIVADAAPVMIWMAGTDKQCTYFNQGWLKFTGRKLEEELGEGWAAGVHPEDLDLCLAIHSTTFDVRAKFSMEYRLRRFDGEYRWILVQGIPRFDSSGAFRGYIGSCIDFSDRKQSEQELLEASNRLAEANQEIAKLNVRLEKENVYLREEIELDHYHHEVIGGSEAIREVLKKAEQVAVTDSTALLLGETGTGKELIARTIHDSSRRKDRPMVKVNCAALPASLVESELFGREKGAYTGALTREIGRFELADGSTIFLDEIGELPLELQAKLLRVLQDGEFERLGSPRTIRVDVRVIAATSRDLPAQIKEGKFREDLFYRLHVFPIQIPPLRQRREDIPPLVWHFVRELSRRMGRSVESIRATTMKAFQNYSWPGNVRELRNVIERHLILNPGPIFHAELPAIEAGKGISAGASMEQIERDHVLRVLEATAWRIRGKGGAADILNLKPTTLESRMKKLGVTRRP